MAKKSRRVRQKGAQPRLSEAQLVQPTLIGGTEPPALVEETVNEPIPAAPNGFGNEYHYVVKDLQRIGLLAAAMLGGLVILSFLF